VTTGWGSSVPNQGLGSQGASIFYADQGISGVTFTDGTRDESVGIPSVLEGSLVKYAGSQVGTLRKF
jgi:hypothetical protein